MTEIKIYKAETANQKIKETKSKILSIAIILVAFLMVFDLLSVLKVTAAPAPRPEISSGNKICIMNLETLECPMSIDENERTPASSMAKMMTAIVVYENVSDLSTLVKVPEEASNEEYIGKMGLISAPRLGLTAGNEYTVKDLLSALLVSSANDAGITLAYYVGGGDINSFIKKMNDKAKELGAQNTLYMGCVGLNDGSYTTAYDSALIAAEFSKISTLIDISSAGRTVTSGMGTLHSKNYLTSDFLIKDYKLTSVKGISAGQWNEESGYSLAAYYASNDLSYVICVMDASGERRNSQAGTRWFEEENAYKDVHKIVPWLKESFEIRNIISPDDAEYSFSIPVKLSAKKDSVMTIPTETVRALTDVTAEKVNYVPEPTFYQTSLEAPVKEGTVVGEVNLYKNGVLIATVPLVTKENAERSEMLAVMEQAGDFIQGETMLKIVKVIIILAIVFVVWSLICFISRIVNKYRNEMGKDYYPPAD